MAAVVARPRVTLVAKSDSGSTLVKVMSRAANSVAACSMIGLRQ